MYQMLVDRAYIPCHGEGLLEYLKSCVHVSVWHLENPDVKQNTMWEKKKKRKRKKISLPADAVCNNCPSKIDNYKADHIASIQ